MNNKVKVRNQIAIFKLIALFILLHFSFSQELYSQQWRGINILESTCDDIKRILGVEQCEFPRSTFYLEDEVVIVNFSKCPCPIKCWSNSRQWNVPKGTVLSLTRGLRTPRLLSEFNVNDGTWKKIEINTDAGVEVSYAKDGTILDVSQNRVTKITYIPSSKYDNLLCPACKTEVTNSSRTNNPYPWDFAYGDIPFDDEKNHLDEMANEMIKLGSNSVGYIVVYVDCDMQDKDGNLRLRRAKDYVSRKFKIGSKRIKTIYAGQSEALTVHLLVGKKGTLPPLTYPTVYPNKTNKMQN